MTDFEMISEFGALDELIQVIYQGASKFIVLSSVADDAWSVYLTLTNSEGRWWSGSWTEKDVLDFVVSGTNYQRLFSVNKPNRAIRHPRSSSNNSPRTLLRLWPKGSFMSETGIPIITQA